MRIKQFIKLTSLLSLVAIGLASCLKDKKFDDGTIQAVHNSNGTNEKLVAIGLSASDASNFFSTAFDNSNNDTTINFVPITLTSPGVATEDVHVTVALDSTIVKNYNANNGASYVIPASSKFTIVNPGGIVTIPKGSRVGYLQIKLKPSAFLGTSWALGFTITHVDPAGYTIAANTKSGLVAFGIKNQYEGKYSSVGYFEHPTAPRAISKSKYLATINATTNAMELGDLGSGTQIYITVNADNTVSIAPGPGANAATHLISGDPVYNNTYNPATKVFKLKYGYPTPATRIITETLTKQ